MRGTTALALFAGTAGRSSRGSGTPVQDPGLAQSRPLPAWCFWRPGGRSSSLGRRGEAQACLFLCSGSPDSPAHALWPPSRASQRRGRASPAARGLSSFRGLSLLGLSSFCGLSFRGLSFLGFSSFFRLSLGPRLASGTRSSSAASSDSPLSFPAAPLLLGTAALSSTFAEGSGGPSGGAQATDFGCNADSVGWWGRRRVPRPRHLPPVKASLTGRLRKCLPGVTLAPSGPSLAGPTAQGQAQGLPPPPPRPLGGDGRGCKTAWPRGPTTAHRPSPPLPPEPPLLGDMQGGPAGPHRVR